MFFRVLSRISISIFIFSLWIMLFELYFTTSYEKFILADVVVVSVTVCSLLIMKFGLMWNPK